MDLQIGQTYSRQEISDALGGSIQSYLPVANGKVVCGCFVPGSAMNPNAPEEVLFGTEGDSLGINKAADLVFAQGQAGEAIPVFMKEATNHWKYVGEYLCIGLTRDPRVVQKKMSKWPLRGKFHGVLRFEQV